MLTAEAYAAGLRDLAARDTDLASLLTGVRVACIGDITATTAAEYGLRTDILPKEFTTDALAQAIADYYSVHLT